MHKFPLSPKKIFLAIFVVLLAAIFFRFLANLSFPDPDINMQKGLITKLQPEDSLTQTFTAKRDGLTKVEFLLRSPGIETANKDKVTVQLADEDCQTPLRNGEMQTSFLSSNNLYEFNFAEIESSKDKTFCLIATFQPRKNSAKAIQFFTMGDDSNQPLSIRPVYTNGNFWQNMTELNQRMSQYKPFFLKHYYLSFLVLSFVILSIGLVAILIIL